MRRDGTMKFDIRNNNLQEMMQDNAILIFPSPHVQAWDHLPRFTFLDVDMKKLINQPVVDSTRHKLPSRSTFVGSPVRREKKSLLETPRSRKASESGDDTPQLKT